MQKNWKLYSGLVALITVSVILLFPYATANYWFDDAFNFVDFAKSNGSYFSLCIDQINSWIKGDGRILLHFFILYGLFYFIKNVVLYHLILVGIFLINIAFFIMLLKKIQCSLEFIAVCVFIFLSLLHITPYVDPIAAFGGLYALLGIFFCASFIFFIQWTKNFSYKYLYISSFIIFISLWFYEINLVYYPLAVLCIFSLRKKISLYKPLLITFIPLILFFLIIFYLRLLTPQINYDGVRIGNSGLYLTTYLKQFFSPLPGIYYFVQGSDSYNLIYLWQDLKSNIYGILLFLLSVISLFCFLPVKSLDAEEKNHIKNSLVSTAAILLLLIPIFMAVSAKYQKTLSWGVGYSPIYYQYFALAIIITALFFKITKNQSLKVMLIAIVALYTTANWMENLQVANYLNTSWANLISSFQKNKDETVPTNQR